MAVNYKVILKRLKLRLLHWIPRCMIIVQEVPATC